MVYALMFIAVVVYGVLESLSRDLSLSAMSMLAGWMRAN